MFARELMFAVIAFILVVPATVFLSFSSNANDIFAVDNRANKPGTTCTPAGISDGSGLIPKGRQMVKCCWDDLDLDTGTFTKYCSTCEDGGTRGKINCSEPVKSGRFIQGDLPLLETVPPNRTLPGNVGDLPTLEQIPSPRSFPGDVQDLPTLEPGPGLNQGTEGEPPLPVICSEEAGLELDEETGQCVPIESPVTGEQPEEPEEQSSDNGGGGGEEQSNEEEQPSEESDSEDNSNN